MSTLPAQLPPGWTSEWDEENRQFFYIETSTGHTQWEPPSLELPTLASQAAAPSRRRQYAAEATKAYYEGDDMHAVVSPLNSYRSSYTPQHGQDDKFHQQSGAGPPTDGLAQQFGKMNLAQKALQLQTFNLLDGPPDPLEIHEPPPEIVMPPNSTLIPSEFSNADLSYQRCTLRAIPNAGSLLAKSKVPLALIITPYRSIAEGDPPVPLITDCVIARCIRCRTYINPYCQFIEGGHKWRCCMCSRSNDVPEPFDWDPQTRTALDRFQRPELSHSVVEFVAPTEYMARAPQSAVYCLLIDVSHAAIQSGMLATATQSILESLDRIPNAENRTKISIIAYDRSLYYFPMQEDTTDVGVLVVPDVDDVFLPAPSSLLVNLSEMRPTLESLLTRLPDMFRDNTTQGGAVGPALQAAFKLISPTGGKIITLCSSLPTVGNGALQARDDSKLYGTSKESSLFQPASFYKSFAIQCSRSHVSVDMFLLGSSYQDLASLASLARYTSGQTYFYPAFDASRPQDAEKFSHEFSAVLSTPFLLEAITRVRATRGLRMSAFHGNFFVQSTDLLAMPAVPQDTSYAIEVEIEEPLHTPLAIFQTAVLHTTSYGERRVRVVTLALPTTTNLSHVFASVDQVALATFMANKAVERALSSNLESARTLILNKLVDIMTAYKGSMTAGGAGASAQLAIPANMRALPLLLLGLTKNVGIRHSSQLAPDLRSHAHALLTTMPSQLLIPYLHPNLYALHTMPPDAGTVGDQGLIIPHPLPLSTTVLERHGLYLFNASQQLFLWVGREAVPQLILDVFDLPQYEALRSGKYTLPNLDNDFSRRIRDIINSIRANQRGPYFPMLYVVKEDGDMPLKLWALSCLIQDRSETLPGYQQWIQTLRDKVNGSGY